MVVYETVEECMAALENGHSFGNREFNNFRDDRNVVLRAVEYTGLNLRYVAERFREDKGVVFKAVSENGGALEFVSPKLFGDREIMMAAASNDQLFLGYASEELRDDFDLVLAGAEEGKNLKFASKRILTDRECVLKIAKVNGYVLEYAIDFRSDMEIAVASVLSNNYTFQLVSKTLASDRNFVSLVLRGAIEKQHLGYIYTSLRAFASKSVGGLADGSKISFRTDFKHEPDMLEKATNWLQRLEEEVAKEKRDSMLAAIEGGKMNANVKVVRAKV